MVNVKRKVVPEPSERWTSVIGSLPPPVTTLPPLSAVIEASFQLVIWPSKMPHSDLRERWSPPGGIVRPGYAVPLALGLNGLETAVASSGYWTIGPRLVL